MASSENSSESSDAPSQSSAKDLMAKVLGLAARSELPENHFTVELAQAILEQLASANDPATYRKEHLAQAPGSSAGLHPALLPDEAVPWSPELRYRALVEKIPAVTFMAALDDSVHDLYISPQIESMLGFTQAQWLEDPFLWYYQLHPDDREWWGAEFARTCALGVDFRGEYRLIARDGRIVWIHGHCQILRDEQGHPLFVQGIAFDITDNKRAEEVLRRAHDELDTRVRARTAELARANEALRKEIEDRKIIEKELLDSVAKVEAANRAKDQFLAILSHELRTPLTPVLSAVEMMERSQDLSTQTRDALSMIRRNVQLEARLIDDLLDLTRIARGTIQLHLVDVDVHESVRHAVQICQAEIDAKKIDLVQALAAAHHLVRADSTRVQQMLWNLLNNAVKFTPNGGRITIHSANDGEGRLVMQISDTGVGIDAEVLPRLFKPFEQGERTISRRFGGLGLGLMITRSLAELHHGTLYAQSEGAGKGATFTLRLDALANTRLPGAPSSPAALPASTPQSQRILLVEDNEDTLRVLARMLKSFGYTVKTATGVKAALDLAAAEPFDLLVSDIGLPDGSGWDIMRHLRKQTSLRGIALSGYGMDEDLRKSREAGFEHHLVKPISFDMLQNAIQRVGKTP